MKLGKILTVVLLLIVLTGVAYGIYTIGYPYLEEYLQSRRVNHEEDPPEEIIVSASIDKTASSNYIEERDEVYFLFHGDIEWDSIWLNLTYGNKEQESILVTQDMLSAQDLQDLEKGGVNSVVVNVGKLSVIITIIVVPPTVDVTYIVSFDTGEGSPVLPVISDANGLVEYLPSTTTRVGYDFKGWTTSDGRLATAPLTIDKNITLHAIWRDKREYTVTFLDKDNQVLKQETNIEHGKNATAPTPPEVVGWNFIRWDGTTNNITEDKTIKAVYEQIRLSIIFRSEEVWGPGNEVVRYVYYGDNLSSNIPVVPELIGHDGEWNISNFDNITANMEVRAVYVIKKFTVTFWSDAWNPNEYVVRTVDYGSRLPEASVPRLPAAREGYDLAWEEVDLTNITSNLTVEAIYSPKDYQVTFRRPLSGGGSSVLFTMRAYYDSHIEPYDTGKGLPDFDVKWYTDANLLGDPIDFSTFVVKGPVTFYVKEVDLRIYIVSLVYEIGGAVGEQFGQIEVTGAGSTLQLPTPPHLEGHTFASWSVPGNYTVSENMTVYARYDINTYMVIFYERDEIISRKSEYYGTYILPPVDYNTEREEFIFDGWYTSPIYTVGTEVDFGETGLLVGAEAIYLYAKWVSIEKGSEGLLFGFVQVSEGEAYYEVIGYEDYSDLAVQIPNTYEGLDVRSITGNAFEDCRDITSIELPSRLEYLGERAFANNYSLTAFITKDDAIYYKDIDGILFTADGSSLVRYPVAKDAVGYIIPASIKTIAKGAFAFTNLDNLVFAENSEIEVIAANAFAGCFGLESIDLPSTITTIENNAFKDCNSLSTVTGGEGLTSVGAAAFANTSWLAGANTDFVTLANVLILYRGEGGTVSLPDHIVVIADQAFKGTLITSITASEDANLAYIGAQAFAKCVLLEQVIILTSEQPEIGGGAFDGIKGNATLYVLADLIAEYLANPMLAGFADEGAIVAYN